jgi:hypothetical protein
MNVPRSMCRAAEARRRRRSVAARRRAAHRRRGASGHVQGQGPALHWRGDRGCNATRGSGVRRWLVLHRRGGLGGDATRGSGVHRWLPLLGLDFPSVCYKNTIFVLICMKPMWLTGRKYTY